MRFNFKGFLNIIYIFNSINFIKEYKVGFFGFGYFKEFSNYSSFLMRKIMLR